MSKMPPWPFLIEKRKRLDGPSGDVDSSSLAHAGSSVGGRMCLNVQDFRSRQQRAGASRSRVQSVKAPNRARQRTRQDLARSVQILNGERARPRSNSKFQPLQRDCDIQLNALRPPFKRDGPPKLTRDGALGQGTSKAARLWRSNNGGPAVLLPAEPKFFFFRTPSDAYRTTWV